MWVQGLDVLPVGRVVVVPVQFRHFAPHPDQRCEQLASREMGMELGGEDVDAPRGKLNLVMVISPIGDGSIDLIWPIAFSVHSEGQKPVIGKAYWPGGMELASE